MASEKSPPPTSPPPTTRAPAPPSLQNAKGYACQLKRVSRPLRINNVVIHQDDAGKILSVSVDRVAVLLSPSKLKLNSEARKQRVKAAQVASHSERVCFAS